VYKYFRIKYFKFLLINWDIGAVINGIHQKGPASKWVDPKSMVPKGLLKNGCTNGFTFHSKLLLLTYHGLYRPDSTSDKTFATGAGGMGFISRADQISHMLPTTSHRCNLEVWSLAQSRWDGHRSLV